MKPSPAGSRMFPPLRHRDFRQLAGGRLLVYFANAMAPVVLGFAVLDLTGSTTDLGFVVGARSLANVVLLLLGGVVADRFPRALVLQGSAAGAALVQAAVALTVLLGWTSLPLLVVLSAANGALSALSLPASAALTRETVSADVLRPANALMRMATNIGMIVGASLGGVVAALVGPGWGLAGNALCLFLAALCFRGVRIAAGGAGSAGPGDAEPSRPLHELKEGWREFTARTWVVVVVLQFTVVNAVTAGGIQVLGLGIADAGFGRGPWGAVLAAQTAGAVVGGILAARSRVRYALRLGVALVVLEAVPLVALAEAPGALLLGVAMFLNGVAMEQFGVAWDVSLQENIPADRLARVYSYDALGSFMALPVGEMAAGPVAHAIGERAALLAGAVLVVLATAAALLSRDVRRLAVAPAAPDRPAGPALGTT
ncbi:MFS transporter [Kitasatospora sp. NPDC056446]|uniref:MFS transporter n=1 Tax=Kitasatospora sp. NPDC056446 TaxID=3345819 RepID=UPI00369EBDDF